MSKHGEIDLKNRVIFTKNGLLKKIYFDYFEMIKKNLLNETKKPCLEIGSSGFIKEVISNCITSNLSRYDDTIDREENIYSLKIKKNSISNIILIDIFHHLEFPKLALDNMLNALEVKGKIIMIEPAMGLIPRIIYKLFHHEPNGFELNIEWNTIPRQIPDKNSYFAAQSIPWRAFIKKEMKLDNQFLLEKVNCFSDFAFLGSGGFSYRSFYPKKIYSFLKFLDKIFSMISTKLFAARMLIVIKKIK